MTTDRLRPRTALGLVGAMALLAGSCGGDDRVTLDDWRRAADKVCERGEEALSDLAPPETDDDGALAAHMEATAAIFDETVVAMAELERPRARQVEIARLQDRLVDTAEALDGYVEALEDDDADAAAIALDEVRDLRSVVDLVSDDLGLSVCGRQGIAAASSPLVEALVEGLPETLDEDDRRCIATEVVIVLDPDEVRDLAEGEEIPPSSLQSAVEAAGACVDRATLVDAFAATTTSTAPTTAPGSTTTDTGPAPDDDPTTGGATSP